MSGDGDDYPDYEKIHRSIKLDEPLYRYISNNSGNFSGTVNRLMWDALGGEIPEEGPEFETANVRKRVLRIQQEALKKERRQLEMMESRIDDALERMEDHDPAVWHKRIDRALKGHKHPEWSRTKLVSQSDPESTNEKGMEDGS